MSNEIQTEVETDFDYLGTQELLQWLKKADKEAEAHDALQALCEETQEDMDLPPETDEEDYARVNAQFQEGIMPGLVQQYGTHDKCAMEQAYNDFTDGLCKDGEITQWQYNNWEHPDLEAMAHDTITHGSN